MRRRGRADRLQPQIGQRTAVPAIIADAIWMVRLWKNRSRDRRELACLSRRELWDMGFNESEAYYEARKPFWRE